MDLDTNADGFAEDSNELIKKSKRFVSNQNNAIPIHQPIIIIIMLYRTTLLSLLAIGVTNAFMTAPSAITRTSPLNLMSAKEIDYIMSEAEQCAAGECALDEVESLITNLQSQQSLLSKRIGEIDTLVKDLEHINGRDNRPVDEVKETVRAIFRVFSLGVS